MFAYLRHEFSYTRPAKLSFDCAAKHNRQFTCPRAEVSKPLSSLSSTISSESLSLGIKKIKSINSIYQFWSENHIRVIYKHEFVIKVCTRERNKEIIMPETF